MWEPLLKSVWTVATGAMADDALSIPGVDLPVVLQRNVRARRMSLRLDAAAGQFRVVAPPKARVADIAHFLSLHAAWARRRLDHLPPRVPFVDGAVIPILGVPHRIRHDQGARASVRRSEGVMTAGGRPEHLARRITDHLRGEARHELGARSSAYARRLGVRIAHVGVRDTRSRWGSCSRTGRLSFCWRLILAPEPVVDYVAAHEVAHLVEPNHSPRFWSLVRHLDPAMDAARTWLKTHGSSLHRFG